jgi:hypothetical protein
MAKKFNESPFNELPESLVQEMLNEIDELGNTLSNSFKKVYENKNKIRTELIHKNLLKKDSEIEYMPSHPTSCGVDGAYAIEKLLAVDMMAVAAVAVEGLTPPSDKRYWPKPRHFSNVLALSHSDATNVVAKALMMCYEIELAAKAPHDVIFLDGSLTTPFISFNIALSKLDKVEKKLKNLFTEKILSAIDYYYEILSSPRTDKIFCGFPKYTTRKEITSRELKELNIDEYEDRGMLSFVLEAGEFISPVPIQKPETPWQITRKSSNKISEIFLEKIEKPLNELSVVYYKPYTYLPALRIEISKSIACNNRRISVLFESIKIQCGHAGIIEPYPLYLADRMVKHISTALPAIRKTTAREMTLKWDEQLGNMHIAMHGYRTEKGR